jgi:hypothetical protein
MFFGVSVTPGSNILTVTFLFAYKTKNSLENEMALLDSINIAC